MLEAKKISKSYGKRKVVNDLSLYLQRGEIVGLLGPNGAGKTTTFSILTGLLSSDGGEVLLKGEEITNLPVYQRARRGLGYLSQEPSIFRKLTVSENLQSVLETLKMSKIEREEKLKKLLSKLSLTHLSKEKAWTLSGGERRRLEITRALIISPSFLLLDEPFSGIDPLTISEIKEIIKNLAKEGIGVLLTDHNVRETLTVTDRSYIMYEGKILISGKAKDLTDNQRAKEIYLGKEFQM